MNMCYTYHETQSIMKSVLNNLCLIVWNMYILYTYSNTKSNDSKSILLLEMLNLPETETGPGADPVSVILYK